MGSSYALASVMVHKGDTVNVDDLKFYAYGSGTEVFLPEIGVEASQQKTPSWKNNGNVFRGWSWNSEVRNYVTEEDIAKATFVSFPLTITEEILKTYGTVLTPVSIPPLTTAFLT